jgi:hypothetical protein
VRGFQQTTDAATTLGSGVDGAVRRITTAFTTLGEPSLITSYNAASGGSVVNQVEDIYNGLDQLDQQFEAINGAVNVETTPSVQYGYTDMSGECFRVERALEFDQSRCLSEPLRNPFFFNN